MACLRLQIVDGQRFSCLRCGRCCRGWFVAVSPDEVCRLRALREKSGKTLGLGIDPIAVIGGYPYVAHDATGNCVFLDSAANLCRLQQVCGHQAKPLGCRIYPLTIASSLPGERSVSARFDCPAVCANHGNLLCGHPDEIRRLAEELGSQSVDTEVLAGMTPAAARRVAELFREQVVANPEMSPARQSLGLSLVAGKLGTLGADILNQADVLEDLIPGLMMKSQASVAAMQPRPLGPLDRAVYRLWLADYLRRDVDLVGKSRVRRLARFWRLCRLFANAGQGYAGITDLPLGGGPTARALFTAEAGSLSPEPVNGRIWECHRRFLATRLQSMQFYGSSYFGESFFPGLLALLQAYALILGVARLAASARRESRIGTTDVCTGVAAVDHAFGRSALLGFKPMRLRESCFQGARFERLLFSLGWN